MAPEAQTRGGAPVKLFHSAAVGVLRCPGREAGRRGRVGGYTRCLLEVPEDRERHAARNECRVETIIVKKVRDPRHFMGFLDNARAT